MGMNWTRVMWVTVAAVGLTAACGGGDKPPAPTASAEPAKTTEPTAAATPAPTASEAPAAAASASGEPAAAASAEPTASGAPAESAAAADDDKDDGKDGKGKGKGRRGKGKHGGGKDRDGDGVPDGKKAKQGGGKDKDGDGKPDKHAEGTGPKADKVITLRQAKMEFNHPGAGWKRVQKGKWDIFRPNDKTGVLAFVEFDKPGESTERLGEMASRLDLSHLDWKGKPHPKVIGKDKLKAMHAEGTCKFDGKHPGEIEYYTIEGAVLVVYAHLTDTKKAAKHEKVATKTVHTLRRL
jgi:hypothetical protein